MIPLRTRLLLAAMLAAAALALPAVSAQAGTTRTPIHGHEIAVACEGPGGQYFFPHEKWFARDEPFCTIVIPDPGSDQRYSGYNVALLNINSKPAPEPAYLTAQMWGTFRVTNQPNTADCWEGTSTARRDERGYTFLRAVAKGHGAYEGMRLELYVQHLSPDDSVPFEYTGYIIEPGNP